MSDNNLISVNSKENTMNTSTANMTNFSVLILNRIQENWSWNPEQLTRCLRTLWKNNKCQDDKSLTLVKTLLSKFESDIRMGGVNFRHTPVVVKIFYSAHQEVYTYNGMNEFERAVEEVSVPVPKIDTTPLVVDIYTDGSQSSKTLCGGWAVVMTSNKGHSKELSGLKANTTNNEMELEAMIKGLEALNYKEGMEVRIHSDSTYVLNALFSMEKFKEKGFGKAKNQDYLQRLMDALEAKGVSVEQAVSKVIGNKELSSGDTVCKAGGIQFVWVKGHADSVGNNKVDILAVEARKQAEKLVNSPLGADVAEGVEETSMVK